MHAFLIVNSSSEHRKKEMENILSLKNIGETSLHRYVLEPRQLVEKSTYSIDDIRTLTSWASQLHSQPSAVIIEEAERLTEPAQQAFLKTLEEGASNMSILLTADSEQSLLPTIRSRCRIIRMTGKGSVLSMEESQRIVSWLEKLSEKEPPLRIMELYRALSKIAGKTISPNRGAIQREHGLTFIEKIIDALHGVLKGPAFPKRPGLHKRQWIAETLKLAATAHRRLTQNLNVSLTLQQFIFDISI